MFCMCDCSDENTRGRTGLFRKEGQCLWLKISYQFRDISYTTHHFYVINYWCELYTKLVATQCVFPLIYSWAMRLSVLFFECIMFKKNCAFENQVPPPCCSHTVTISNMVRQQLQAHAAHLPDVFPTCYGTNYTIFTKRNRLHKDKCSVLIQSVCMHVSLGWMAINKWAIFLFSDFTLLVSPHTVGINGIKCNLHFRDQQKGEELTCLGYMWMTISVKRNDF